MDIELIPENPLFYQSFIDVMDEKFSVDGDVATQVSDPSFRSDLMRKNQDVRMIEEIAPYMAQLVKKPQKVAVDMESFYMAEDLLTRTHYMAFKDVLMVDIDSYKMPNGDDIDVLSILPHCRCQIQAILKSFKDENEVDVTELRKATWMNYKCKNKKNKTQPICTYRYRLFKSRNGWHAFVVSHAFHYRDREAIQLMIEAMADYFYVIFTYLRSWCVRLNRKGDEIIGPKGMYPEIGDVIRGKLVSRRDNSVQVRSMNEKLIDLHIDFASQAAHFAPVRVPHGRC